MNIFISENIAYLLRIKKLNQDDFGTLFELNRGTINNYVRKIATPKIETIVKICDYFNISIDDFVTKSLEELKYTNNEDLNTTSEPPPGYGFISLKYVETLEITVETQKKLLKEYEEKLLSKKKVIELA